MLFPESQHRLLSNTQGKWERLPDRPSSILVQEINTSLSLAKVLSGSLDLELHEALPPVINLACAGGKHANGHLHTHSKTNLTTKEKTTSKSNSTTKEKNTSTSNLTRKRKTTPLVFTLQHAITFTPAGARESSIFCLNTYLFQKKKYKKKIID